MVKELDPACCLKKILEQLFTTYVLMARVVVGTVRLGVRVGTRGPSMPGSSS